MHKTLDATYRGTPITRMRLRPYLSDNGPQSRELMLIEIKNTTSDKFTNGSEHFSCWLMVGSAGRYKSVDNGGKEAIDATSIIIILSESCLGDFRPVSEIVEGESFIKLLNL